MSFFLLLFLKSIPLPLTQSQSKPAAEFNLRRAGEGVDNAQWGGMVALKKKDEESDDSEDSGPEIAEKQEKLAGEAKKKGGKQVRGNNG